MIIKAHWFLNILSKLDGSSVESITLFPFIIVGNTAGKRLINHERIHLIQQLECLIVPFYILYIGHYFINRLKYKHDEAYRNVIFEKEAYKNMYKLDYLKNRGLFAWVGRY
jgi:uncharacterized radical SAM superfamily protein